MQPATSPSDFGPPTLFHTIVRQASSAQFRRLVMPRPVLIVVETGRKTIAAPDGRRWSVERGAAMAISMGLTVDVINDAPDAGAYRAEVFVFPEGIMPRHGRGRADVGALAIGPELADCLDRCRRLVADPDSVPEVLAAHRVRELALWIEAAGIDLTDGGDGRLSTTVRAIVGAAPGEDWSTEAVLGRLASRGHAMSAPTLRRRLADEGTGLTDIVTDVRMAVALDRLQTTDQPITTIALDVGYDSPSRFAARFRARFDVPPSAIRSRAGEIERPGTSADRIGAVAPAAP